MTTKIILASGSQNRRDILRSLGVQFEVVPSNVDERSVDASDSVKKAEEIARLKARTVASMCKGEAIVIAADTFGILDGTELQKPKDLDDARLMLRMESTKRIKMVTGMCTIDLRNGEETTTTRTTFIRCKKLTAAEIESYITTRPVTEWAGCYNPQDRVSATLFTPMSSYIYGMERFSLPMDALAKVLGSAGIKIDIVNLNALPDVST